MRRRWVGVSTRKNCGSHTARSGQEPHTPGGTVRVLRGWRRAQERGEFHTVSRGQELHAPGGTKVIGVSFRHSPSASTLSLLQLARPKKEMVAVLTIVITVPVLCYYTAVGWVSGTQQKHSVVENIAPAPVPECSHEKHPIVKSSRLRQECTQHQHSVVKYMVLASRVCAAPALNLGVHCACVGNVHSALDVSGDHTRITEHDKACVLRSTVEHNAAVPT